MQLLFAIILGLAGLSQAQSRDGEHNKSNSTALATYSAVPQLPRNSSSVLTPLYQPYSDKTPVFENDALLQKFSQSIDAKYGHLDPLTKLKRQSGGLPEGTCAPGIPCTNGACCSNTGICSYANTSCGVDVCISNCNATAPCGQYAVPGKGDCPLNVCCSKHGFCGSDDDYCGDGCQAGFGGCGPPPTPSCSKGSNSALKRRIGYYESWATTRRCDKVAPEDLDLTGLTHINFAFAFFDPSTFQISPMDANAGSLYSRFTALKKKQPGLQTWISIGGWSFNDATNSPNTQTAFSDMVGSADNRRAFIVSLRNFMQTYGFDGVDLDWEYPAADDRGGVEADFSNFPSFLAELRASLGSGVGITVTLPSSYWYLQHFDVVAMEPHLDWMNLMSYDIHGVWDSGNKHTGPYIRPHTNITEINLGLDLLWRAGVSPLNVVLGLGWYGRSFTLSDPSCNTPNGVCEFSGGGTKGECTASSGTLSNAEIKRILASGAGAEGYDATAGVKWLTWNSNQWVSYDDGVTIQQKIANANGLCLGGIMIWAIDQDNTAGDSMNDLLGVGAANGVPAAAAQSYKEQLANATLQQAVASSCYWSLCGEGCTTGYFGATAARGQVAGFQENLVCPVGQIQTLCCAPGTTMGSCKWEGFRGVGFPCSPACSDPKATIVARNSNSHQQNEGEQTTDLTCTGGYQAYCCSGFIPSSITNTGNLNLYGQDPTALRKRGEHLDKRAAPLLLGGLGALCAEAAPLLLGGSSVTFGLSAAVEGAICAAAAASAAAIGFAVITNAIGRFVGWLFGSPPTQSNTGQPTTIGTRTAYGQWQILDFGGGGGGGQTTSSCDCFVTYTCRYGMGWDEICDNQRWAINKMLNGRTSFQPFKTGRAENRAYYNWGQSSPTQRHAAYRTLIQGSRTPRSARCELDEFPMGNLRESGNNAPQVCRLVNGPANNAQGGDWKAFKTAQWLPCSTFRSAVCGINDDGPYVTWRFNQLNGNRGPGNGKHFVSAYGFDSQTPNSECFASFTYTVSPASVTNTMVTDHAFRVLDDDPMFGRAYGWPRQPYSDNPAPTTAYKPIPYNPGIFQRGLLEVENSTFANNTDSSVTCHFDENSQHDEAPWEDADLDYDNLLFIDEEGNFVDGRTCDVIYEDHPGSGVQLVVDKDGKVSEVYTDDHSEAGDWHGQAPEVPVTAAETVYITLSTEAASPPSGVADTMPASTTASVMRAEPVATLALPELL